MTQVRAYRGKDPYVFVCYAHADSERVYAEIDWLDAQGVKVWYDEGISAGKNWRAAIGDSLLGADSVLFYLSSASLVSDHCNREINLALDEAKTVIPVYLDEVELTADLKIGLSRVQALRHDDGGHHRRPMLEALGRAEERQQEGEQKGEQASAPAKVDDEPDRRTGRLARRGNTWKWVAGALVALLVTVGGWFYSEFQEGSARFLAVAVVPFTSIDGDASVAATGRNLATSVLQEIGQQRAFDPSAPIRVASAALAFRMADAGAGVQEIANTLNVNYVLEGSVGSSGDTQTVSVQLLHAADRYQVWSKTLEFDSPDDLARVARHLATLAALEITIEAIDRLPWYVAAMAGIDKVAFAHFFDALRQYSLYLLGEPSDVSAMIGHLEKAVEVDPKFTFAWAFIANQYLSGRAGNNYGERVRGAHAAIERALALQPDNFVTQLQLAQIKVFLDLDYGSAEESLERIIATWPGKPWLHLHLARIAVSEGRAADARRYMRAAASKDAAFEQATSLSNDARLLCVLGEYEAALARTDTALQLVASGGPRVGLLIYRARARLMLGRIDEARSDIEEALAISDYSEHWQLAALLAGIGETERARTALAGAPGPFALGHLALGDIDATFDAIRFEIEERNFNLVASLRLAEWWDPIRDDPRFAEMLDLLESITTHTPAYLRGLEESRAGSE